MTPIIVLITSIVLLIVSVTRLKVHPIPALLISGLVLGLASGGSVHSVTQSLLNGFGDTLKWIGLIIFFGTLLGEILSATGGSDLIADSIIKLFGIKYLPYSMAAIGFIIGIPVFMDVAYLTLLPTLVVLSKKSNHSILTLGLSLSMSLTVAHALIPPTPGPLAVAAILGIEVGQIIPLNITIALIAIGCGLLGIRLISAKGASFVTSDTKPKAMNDLRGIRKVLPFAAILIPLLLMSIGTIFNADNGIVEFIKNPVWALMIGLVFVLPLLRKDNFTQKLNNHFQNAGAKSAIVILITGTGGAFGQVIKDTQIVESLISDAPNLAALGILVPFFLGLLFTTVTGSITVSLITTASIVAPMVTNGTMDPSYTTAAICAGSLGVIHVNSSFFWLFKEVHHLSTTKVLKSFSLLSLLVSLSAGLAVFILSLILG
ncbi:GntP family permease [Maribacter thermophilus]|uniref:GntP family permease n=1 Tax=Maribacter thermophilus TaxID=1197874 RepID=UPI000640F329|nr:gluconate transporter [Maribacter thermophilus]